MNGSMKCSNFWLRLWMNDWLIDWLTDWLIDWLIVWIIDWLTDWLIGWLTYWLTDWLVDWLIDWLTDWLIDWFSWRENWKSHFVMRWWRKLQLGATLFWTNVKWRRRKTGRRYQANLQLTRRGEHGLTLDTGIFSTKVLLSKSSLSCPDLIFIS